MKFVSESSDAGPEDIVLKEAQRLRNLFHFCERPEVSGKVDSVIT